MNTFSGSKLVSYAKRALDYSFLRTMNQISGPLKEKIFFLHLHKCGGVSINKAIQYCYRDWNLLRDNSSIYLDSEASFLASNNIFNTDKLTTNLVDSDYIVQQYREKILLYYMYSKKTQYIGGHFTFNQLIYQNFSQDFSFVTMLRDPIQRWKSFYFFNRYKEKNHGKLNIEILDFLKSDYGKKYGCLFVMFLGGINKEGKYTSKEAIQQAKENLHKFDIVGFIEHQEKFAKKFQERFGKRLIIHKLNQNPKPEAFQKTIINTEIEKRIIELCHPDIEVYQYAVKNFLD